MVVSIRKSIVFLISLTLPIIFLSSSFAGEAIAPSDKKIELPKEAVSKKILANGLVVLTKSAPPPGLVSIDVKIRSGSSFEDEYLGSGISHLVEHMLFKGTKTRGTGAIESQIRSYGGFINGSVSQDMTSYHITIPSRYLKEALGILKDMLLNGLFDSAELAREKEVILKEIRLNEDDPQSELVRLLNETAYTVHPYKYPPIGYEEKFKNLTGNDVIRYYNRMYAPNRMVVSIVGDIDTTDAIVKVEGEFKNFRPPNYAPVGFRQREPPQIVKRYLEVEAPINLSYLAVAFHSTSVADQDLFALDVLAMILGRGDNSRLNTSLFKNKRLVYSVSCWNYTPSDHGLFVVTAILDRENLAGAEDAIADEIGKVLSGTVADYEIEAAKRKVLSDFIFSRQTIDEQSADLASNYILTASYDFSRRYVEGVQAVTQEDIKKVARAYLRSDNLTVVRIVPKGPKPEAVGQAQALAKKDEIKREVLPNGLRLLVREDPTTPTVSITVAMLGGLMVEDKATNGISNLTASMLLKGTHARNEKQIKGAIESLGGDLSHFSGFNSFGLSMEILKTDLDESLNILKDVLADSVFPKDELDRQKGLVLAMIKDEDDDIFQRASNALRKEVFGDSPYGLRYNGEKDSVEALKREDLINFYRAFCVPNNMVISISGDVEREAVTFRLKKIFSDLTRKEVAFPSPAGKRLDRLAEQNLQMDKEESLVLEGFETTNTKDPDRYVLDVMSSILSGSSGRLFNELRDKLSLAYTLGCVQKLGLERGYLIFYVATTAEKILDVKKALSAQIRFIREKTVSGEELVLAKRELKTAYLIGKETNHFFSFNSAIDELYGLGYDNLYKYEAEIDKVTSQDVKRVAEKYLDTKASAVVVVLSQNR